MGNISKVSRRVSRMCLVQMLCSRYFLKDHFDKNVFLDAFFIDKYKAQLDISYIDDVFEKILSNSDVVAGVITKYASRFVLEDIPPVHIAIISIAISEVFFIDEDIPFRVSINEALELTKRYSDDKGKSFINGFLNTACKLELEDINSLKLKNSDLY